MALLHPSANWRSWEPVLPALTARHDVLAATSFSTRPPVCSRMQQHMREQFQADLRPKDVTESADVIDLVGLVVQQAG